MGAKRQLLIISPSGSRHHAGIDEIQPASRNLLVKLQLKKNCLLTSWKTFQCVGGSGCQPAGSQHASIMILLLSGGQPAGSQHVIV